ncbi:MAG: GNAT family N-acetyltransferase [Sphaerochaetaceae bacterium]
MKREVSRHVLHDATVVKIRSLNPRDATKAVAYIAEMYASSPYMSAYSDEWTTSEREEVLFIKNAEESSSRLLLGAFVKGELVALGDFSEISRRERLKHRAITSLSVAPSFQGRGLGTLMMSVLIEQAPSAGYEQLELEVVEHNKRAIHLYEKLGFQHYGKLERGMKNRDGSYWSLLLMRRPLGLL